MPIPAGIALMLAAASGCSDIRQNTFEVELTTDREPQTVELWYQPNERSKDWALAYRVRFAQSYYPYRDNHYHLKQTTIGMLLDKNSFAPLTEVIGRDRQIEEPLSLAPGEEGALKRQLDGHYRQRRLWVMIWGLRGRKELGRQDMPRILASAPPLRTDHGFDIVKQSTSGATNKELPDIVGYSAAGRVIRMACPSDVRTCSFETEFRHSRMHFSLPRSEMALAHNISERLVRLIEQHLVQGEEQS